MIDENNNGQISIPNANQPISEQQPESDTWAPGTEEQLPAEIAQAQTIQKEVEQGIEQSKPQESESSVDLQKIFPKKKSPQDSFAELKARALRAERERDEALARLQTTSAQDEDYTVNIAPDELAEGKHLSKMQKQMAKLQQQVRDAERKAQNMAMEVKLKQQFPDFDEVVSTHNLELLEQHDPESAFIVQSISDMYAKSVAAYRSITKLAAQQKQEYVNEAEKLKAQRNAAKPRPAVAINPQTAENPMARVNAFAEGLTPELEKQLRKEMADAIRNR